MEDDVTEKEFQQAVDACKLQYGRLDQYVLSPEVAAAVTTHASFPPMAPYPLSLDLEETPRLPDLLPDAPLMPMPPEAKKLFTPEELVAFKTVDVDPYKASGMSCYICAKHRVQVRVKNGGMAICYDCALFHFGHDDTP